MFEVELQTLSFMGSNKKLKIIVFSLVVIGILSVAFFTFAKDLEVDYPLFEKAPKLTEKSTLTDYIGYIFNFIIFASGFIILGVLIYSGILYLLSVGDPGRRSEAKNRIINGFVGIIIILSSYLILTTISPSLVIVHLTTEGIKITEPGEKPEPNTPEEDKKTITLFQVPSGKIVERLVLDDAAATFLGTNDEIGEPFPFEELLEAIEGTNENEEDEEEFQQIYDRIQEEFRERNYTNSVWGRTGRIKDLSELIIILSYNLKYETDYCNCGPSRCDEDCNPTTCDTRCHPGRIMLLEYLIRGKGLNTGLADQLLEQRELVKENQMALIEKVVQLKQPSFLVSLMAQQTEGITDYKTILTQKHFLNKQQIEVKTETFDKWKDSGENPDNTTDDSLVMDVRTGFAERKDMPPTFDPTTLYFERNKKTNVFIASAELIDFEKLKSYIEEGLNREFTDKEYSVEDILNGIFNDFEEVLKKDPKDVIKEIMEKIVEEIVSFFGLKKVKAQTGETVTICDVEIPIGESMDTTYDFLIELIEKHQKLYEAIPKQVENAKKMAIFSSVCDTEDEVRENCVPTCIISDIISAITGLPICVKDLCFSIFCPGTHKFLPDPVGFVFLNSYHCDIRDACPTDDINDAWNEQKKYAFTEKEVEDEEENQPPIVEPEQEIPEFIYGGVIGSSANILALIKGKDTINEDGALNFLIEERDREGNGEKSRIIKIDKTVPIDENIKTPEEKKKEEKGEKLEGIPLLQYIDRKLRVARQEFNECALTPQEISALSIKEEWPRMTVSTYNVIQEKIYRLPERLTKECIKPCKKPGSQDCFRCMYKSLFNFCCCH